MKRVCGTQKIVSIVNSRAWALETDTTYGSRRGVRKQKRFNKGGKPEITVTE